jgi:peptidoglycan/xylan/chitin deacetylase (PgdA/CDA1 family)
MTFLRAATLLLAGLLAGCSTLSRDKPLRLAVTVDDLPVHGPLPPGDTAQRIAAELIAGLRAGGAREAHGFLNGHWTQSQPATRDILRQWREAGLPLANHGWAHRNLNELSIPEFEQEVARNEPILQQVARRDEWHWFRYPFLAEGDDPAKRSAARAVLARRGYRIAAVTMDFSDWRWTGAYARCHEQSDRQSIDNLERAYLDAARESIRHSRFLSHRVHRRDIPYVLLLHGGAFTARMMPRLLRLYRDEGFRFVSLEQAQRDRAYATITNPARPGPAATLEGQAAARNIPVPPRSGQEFLDLVCT